MAVALPELVGFLSAFSNFVSYFVTGESVTPFWVHPTRISAAWIAVVIVFAWFVARHEGPFVKHFTIVVVLTWMCSELLFTWASVVHARTTAFDGPIWEFRLQSVGFALLRALTGLAIGLAMRGQGSGTLANAED